MASGGNGPRKPRVLAVKNSKADESDGQNVSTPVEEAELPVPANSMAVETNKENMDESEFQRQVVAVFSRFLDTNADVRMAVRMELASNAGVSPDELGEEILVADAVEATTRVLGRMDEMDEDNEELENEEEEDDYDY